MDQKTLQSAVTWSIIKAIGFLAVVGLILAAMCAMLEHGFNPTV